MHVNLICVKSNQLISDHLVRRTLVFAPNYSVSHLVQLKKRKKTFLAVLLSRFTNTSREVRHLLNVSPVIWISFFFSENRVVETMTLKSLPFVDIYKPQRVEVKL